MEKSIAFLFLILCSACIVFVVFTWALSPKLDKLIDAHRARVEIILRKVGLIKKFEIFAEDVYIFSIHRRFVILLLLFIFWVLSIFLLISE